MTIWNRFFAAGVVLLVLSALGCGDGGPPRGTVLGAVTLDGKPVETGGIRFSATDGKSPTAGGAIKGGRYAAEVPVGEMRVEITAPRVVGQRKEFDTPNSPLMDVTEEAVPARYNAKSELLLTVRPGKNEKDFDLHGR